MSRSLADLLFRPRSVVVYGASSDPDKLSGRPLDYLQRFGFTGEIHAINPRRDVVQGVRSYSDIADVPGPVDLAVIVVPADSVVDAVRRCAKAGVGAAIIYASGFAEIGETGEAVQQEIVSAAASTGMRVVGPNCLGTFSAPTRVFATFSTAFDEETDQPDSPIALVSQSGAVGSFTYTTMTSLGVGVRYFANTGNSCDVSVVEILAALVDAPDVDILLGHLEGVPDLHALDALAQTARAAGKPLVLLKAGRTAAGARAVRHHTASVAGNDAEFTRILAAHGAVRVDGMEELAEAALAFSSGRRAIGRRLTVVTQSGGAGAMAADTAVEVGLEVEPWSSVADRDRLGELLPYFGSIANPVDCTGALINDVTILERTLEIVCQNDDTDAILVVLGNCDKGAAGMVAALQAAHKATSKPFFVSWTGGSGQPRRELLAAGVPTYAEPARAVRALSRLCPPT
ncbi:CoA-binding protein [Rhodococcus opacus]|uniref:acetate--CoA ligase family protein n=1 Tax=Rhodococcus opacus TaxID=37919 RepID=UPI00146D90D8|nr:CoA-binding protein [Rhodococcus opacus]MDV7088954.1 CoA-binding protein [Rhodococcus opacus]WKN60241.1 CoA-binding protein [Rhodococcus opacus]